MKGTTQMDPNANLRAIRAEVETHLEHGDGDIDVLVEHVKALDEFLSTGGFRPTAWLTFSRRTRPVRADDATHPRELPDPADEARRAEAITRGRVNDTVTVESDDTRRRRAASAGLEAIVRELNSRPTWRGDA